MAHIIINPSLSAAIGYKFFFNPPKFSVVIRSKVHESTGYRRCGQKECTPDVQPAINYDVTAWVLHTLPYNEKDY